MIFTISDESRSFAPWSRHLDYASRTVWWEVRCASQRNHACLASTILSVVLERRGDLARFRLSLLPEVGIYDQQSWESNRIALVRFYGELRSKTHSRLMWCLLLWVELFADFIVFANKRRFYLFSCKVYSFVRFENIRHKDWCRYSV